MGNSFEKMWAQAAADASWQYDELVEECPELVEAADHIYFVQMMVYRRLGIWLRWQDVAFEILGLNVKYEVLS